MALTRRMGKWWLRSGSPLAFRGASHCAGMGGHIFFVGLSCPARPESESESEVKKIWYFGAVELQCLSCSRQFNSGVASIVLLHLRVPPQAVNKHPSSREDCLSDAKPV